MGGLDFTPGRLSRGPRSITGALSAYHRTVVDRPQLAVLAPAAGRPASRRPVGPIVVAAELDAGDPPGDRAASTCASPNRAALTPAGWTWRADLPAPRGPAGHTLTVRGPRRPRRTTRGPRFEVCEGAPATRGTRPAPTGRKLGGWTERMAGARRDPRARAAAGPALGPRRLGGPRAPRPAPRDR